MLNFLKTENRVIGEQLRVHSLIHPKNTVIPFNIRHDIHDKS